MVFVIHPDSNIGVALINVSNTNDEIGVFQQSIFSIQVYRICYAHH